MRVRQGQVFLERGLFAMPKPQGRTVERMVSLFPAAVVFTAQLPGGGRSARLRVLTSYVGVLLHRLGLPTAAEPAQGIGPELSRGAR